jgi:hypothetical protein
MSLFHWFAKKKPTKPSVEAESSGLGHVDATVPFQPSGRGRTRPPAAPGSAANRKHERLERRELLYAVVRQSMTKVGILSANYKFKVLSLDSHGRQYLIMMDLTRLYAAETGRLAEIEALIAQTAKALHGIMVTSVYWRVNEHVTTGFTRSAPPVSAPAPLSSTPTVKPPPPKPSYEPLQADEVAAFKQALASVASPKTLASPGEIIHSGRRNPAPAPNFADTELDDRPTPLSGTQYGDL